MRKNYFLIIISFLFIITGSLFAQEMETSVSETLSDQKYIQRITWEGDENAWQYGVTIVSAETGEEALVLTTEETFVTFTLPPAEYKYKISVYDLFGHVALESGWCSFTITKAVQPKVEIVDDNISTSKKRKIEIPVQLEDISENSKVVLINTETKEEVAAEFKVENNQEESSSVKKITVPGLNEGNWIVKVTNPGGKTTVSEDITIDYKKKTKKDLHMNFQLEGGYLFIVNQDEIFQLMNDEFSLCAGGRISFTPFQINRNIMGLEIAGSSNHKGYHNTILKMDNYIYSLLLNFMYQYELIENHLYVDGRVGTGVSLFETDIGTPSSEFNKTYGYVTFDAGVFMMYKPVKFLNIELGAQANLYLVPEVPIFAVTPVLLLGVSL